MTLSQQEEQHHVQVGGAPQDCARVYQGRRDEQRRNGVDGVRSRGAAYGCQGLQPMRSQEVKRKIRIQSSNVLSPQKLQDSEGKTETSN